MDEWTDGRMNYTDYRLSTLLFSPLHMSSLVLSRPVFYHPHKIKERCDMIFYDNM